MSDNMPAGWNKLKLWCGFLKQDMEGAQSLNQGLDLMCEMAEALEKAVCIEQLKDPNNQAMCGYGWMGDSVFCEGCKALKKWREWK